MDLIKYKSIHWLNISDVTMEEVNFLENKYHFHALDLEDCLSQIQRTKIDEYEKYLFIVLHFPIQDKRTGYFISKEIDIFLSKNYIITIQKNGNFPVIDDLLNEMRLAAKERREFLALGPSFFLYKLLTIIFDNLFPKIDEIDQEISFIEEDIFELERHRNVLKDIMIIKRNIINMRRILLPLRAVIATFEHKSSRFNISDLDIYFDDIVDKVEKLWNNLETSKEVSDSLQETYESLLSHNISHVMKVFTVLSVVIVPLVVIPGLYGMNVVSLPFATSPWVFWGINLFMILITVFLWFIFKWKKWL